MGYLLMRIGGISPRTAFDRIVRGPLEKLCQSGFQDYIIILVDALDEALTYPDEKENIVTLLGHVAGDLPEQVRFLLTSRPVPQILKILQTIGFSSLDLVKDLPQGEDDVGQYVARKLSAFPETGRHELIEQVVTAANGNFLYARYVVDDLLSCLNHSVDWQDLTLPKDLEDIYRQFLQRELSENLQLWNEQYGPVLGAIALSRESGLTRDQLFGITQVRQNPQITEGKMDSILQACSQYLSAPGPQGPFHIYHRSFRDFLLADNEYPIYSAEVNQDIANYFLDEHEDWIVDEELYAVRSLVTHLIEATRQTKQRRVRESLSRLMIQNF